MSGFNDMADAEWGCSCGDRLCPSCGDDEPPIPEPIVTDRAGPHSTVLSGAVIRSSSPRTCAVCQREACGSLLLPDNRAVCDGCAVKVLSDAIGVAEWRRGDGVRR